MKRILSLAAACLCAASFGAPAYFMLKQGNFENGSVKGETPEKVVLSMKTVPVAKKNHLVACRNIKMDVTAQKKVMFRVKGASHLGAGAHVTAAISYTARGGNKWFSAIAPNIKVDNKEYRSYTLGLDTEFKLPDASYTLRQIKFVINGAGLPAGTDMTVSIDGIHIGDAAEGSAGDITVVPPPFPKEITSGTRKIFFELENDDDTDYIFSRYHAKWLRSGEPVVPAGFAELILKNTSGIFSETKSISDADVIIYARVNPGKNGEAIRKAAAAGKTLIAAGAIPDKELAKIMPLTVKPRSTRGLPERRTLVFNKRYITVDNPNTASFPQVSECEYQGDSTNLITFSDGQPFLTRNKNICHFANTIGATVEKSDVFFDKLLLRLASDSKTLAALNDRESEYLAKCAAKERAAVSAALKEAGVSGDNWKVGASQDNFSRFGWRIGVALGCGILNNDLSFTSGDQSFKLFNFGSESTALDKWQLRALDKGVILPAGASILSNWDGKGRVRYTTSAVIPESWKDLEIAFEVSSGIDDTDELYLNGKLAGKTGTDVKEYWATPRRYVLDKSLIKFGKVNALRLDVRNINGRAAVLSAPRLTAKKAGSAITLTVPSLNWAGRVCKAVSGENSYSVHHTMALPLMLHDFGKSESASLTLENIAKFAAYELKNGKVVIRKFSGSDFYNAKRDGEWGKPYLLLFRNDISRPLLLVFNRKISKIEASVRDGEATNLKFVLDGKNNIIAAGFPFGAAAVSGAGWDKALPGSLRDKIGLMVKFAFNYPEHIEELYRVDRKAGKIGIINHFKIRHISNIWGVPAEKYAFLPPLSAYLHGKKLFVGCDEKLTDFNIPTSFGPTCGVTGKSAIAFTFDLPDNSDFQLPGYIDKVCNDRQNAFFADGVLWSCGGRTPMTAWSAARPNGVPKGCNIDIFAWNFGLNSAMQGIFSLNDQNVAKLHHRVNTRFLEPVEKYMWKCVLRHRYEPFSGIVYPCLLQNYHSIYTPFAKGTGSNVTFGDANEAHAVFMWLCQQLEDLSGQKGLSAANWNFLRYIARYQLCIDDYAFQSGSCRDFGTGAWIDMLNCEYGGMMAYARNAELAGDKREADSAIYRAARRAVPTIARMYFRDYFDRLYPEKKKVNLQITGFGEAGAKYMMYPASNFNFMAAMDLFDFSEGFMGTMIRLYDKYAKSQVEEHIAKRAYPSLRAEADKNRNCNYAYLPPLALYMTDDAGFDRYAADTLKYNNRMGDWPAMRRAFEINSYLWRKNGKVTFRDFRSLNISKAVCLPSARELTLDYSAEKNSLLTVESAWQVSSVDDNGKAITPDIRNGLLYLPVTPGKHQVKVRFK